MRKKTIISLFIAIILIVTGGSIFTLTLAKENWGNDIKNYLINTYELKEEFNKIYIDTDSSDINLIYSNENKVECYEKEKVNHNVEIIDNTLNIKVNDTRKPHEKLFGYSVEKITIYLSKQNLENLQIDATSSDVSISKEFEFTNADIDITTGDVEFYGNVTNKLNIEVTTGDIDIDGISSSKVNIKTTTGDVDIKNVTLLEDLFIKVSSGETKLFNITCNNLTSEGTTGEIELKNVILSGKLFIHRSTGDVYFNKCDANEIEVKVTTGDIEGSLLSSKNFIVDTTTGKRHVPSSSNAGGVCKLTSTTGDIIITIED